MSNTDILLVDRLAWSEDYAGPSSHDELIDEFDSASIDQIGFDRETDTIYVEFSSGSTIYSYAPFKESTYNFFIGAVSPGNFWREYIKEKAKAKSAFDTGLLELREEDTADLDSIVETPKLDNLVKDDNVFAAKPNFAVAFTVSTGGVWDIDANSPEDALRKFNEYIAAKAQETGETIEVKVKAVTQFFE